MKTFWATLVVAVLGNLAIAIAAAGQAAKADRVFELRTYHTAPGKMGPLHVRFRDHTNKLLVKHGMEPLAFWVPAEEKDGGQTLVWLVAHASREAADKNWKAFGADPDWKAAKAKSEEAGKLVNKVERVFLKPTNYSPMK